MADFAEVLRRSVAADADAYTPSPDLARRIARRTLQLQRRRRFGIAGGALGVALLLVAVPVAMRPLRGSDDKTVAVAVGAVNQVRPESLDSTSTTLPLATAQLPVLDLSGLVQLGIDARNRSIAAWVSALRNRPPKEAAKVLDALVASGDIAPSDVPAIIVGVSNPPGTTATTKKPSGTTKPTVRTTTTTTTTPPPTESSTTTTTTTTPAPPVVPLALILPAAVCEGAPTTFTVTGTGADLVQWNNGPGGGDAFDGTIGATATYTFTGTNGDVGARLMVDGSQAWRYRQSVPVTPVGIGTC